MSKPTAFGLFQLVWHFLKRFGIFLQVVWHFLFTWTWQPWLVDLCYRLTRIGWWGRMCDPYVKESFLTAIPQSFHRDIQPCIVSSVEFSFKVVFVNWQKCGFSLSISIDLSHYLCLKLSPELCLIEVQPPSLHMRLWYIVCLYTSTVCGYAFHLPSRSHADGIREFLFV